MRKFSLITYINMIKNDVGVVHKRRNVMWQKATAENMCQLSHYQPPTINHIRDDRVVLGCMQSRVLWQKKKQVKEKVYKNFWCSTSVLRNGIL